jgi:hypothetical protein
MNLGAFKELVAKHNGRHKEFSHIGFLQTEELQKLLGSERRGQCGGLSILWLSRYDKDHIQGDLFLNEDYEPKKFSQIAASTQGRYVIYQLQKLEVSRFIIADTLRKKYKTANNSDKVLLNKQYKEVVNISSFFENCLVSSLKHEGIKFPGDATFSVDKLDDMIAHIYAKNDVIFGHDYAGHLIALPNHYVAAITDFHGKGFKFFDPNYGQALFTSKHLHFGDFLTHTKKLRSAAVDFRSFLAEFFADAGVQEIYAMKDSAITVASYFRD